MSLKHFAYNIISSITFASVAIGVSIVIVVAAMVHDVSYNARSISFGISGAAEVRCIDGYKFIIGERGHVMQMLNQDGKGEPCNN
jgi:hypothetical protein